MPMERRQTKYLKSPIRFRIKRMGITNEAQTILRQNGKIYKGSIDRRAFCRKVLYSVADLFQMDGSIPRFFWRLFNPLDGRYLKYYVQHDFIYATGMRERKDADILLRKGLEKAQMNFFGRWAVYFSVRLFGSKHYNKFEKF